MFIAGLGGAKGDGATGGVPKSGATVTGPTAIGALFTIAKDGSLGSHFCTASVVESPAGDVILTAAHCTTGRTVGTYAFVPGYNGGRPPLGIWTVTATFVDQAWAESADPDDDFAFLIVQRTDSDGSLQRLTGAEHMGAYVSPSRRFHVVGYPDTQNRPIGCTNSLVPFTPTQLQFDCGGYTNGTSGSPLIANPDPATGLGIVIGVIGGYEQGGDTSSVSYAARFGPSASTLYDHATSTTPDPATHH